MKGTIIGTAALVACLGFGSMASAGVFADDLSRCMVRSSTQADNTAMVRWTFSMLSANPAVASLVQVTAAQRQDMARRMVGIMERLLFVDCHKETIAALKNEGTGVFEASFSVLGETATRNLMADPQVAAQLRDLGGFIDKEKWQAAAKEAGVDMPGPAAN